MIFQQLLESKIMKADIYARGLIDFLRKYNF